MPRLRDALLARWVALPAETSALVILVAGVAIYTAAVVLLHVRPTILAPVYSLALLVFVGLLFRRLGFDGWSIAIVLGALSVDLGYLTYTDFGERNYDAGEQLRYVRYLLEHHARPPAGECLICHHPPLYYAIGALVYAFFDQTRLAPPVTGLQIYGLACHLVLVGYAAAICRRVLGTRRELHLALALVAFWPYAIENSVRVHNDTLASTLMCAATFYLIRWASGERPRDLYLTAVVIGLGLLTKSSAVVIAAALFAVLLFKLIYAGERRRLVGRAAVAALILLGAFALGRPGKGSPASNGSPLCHAVLGNACDIQKVQWVDNRPLNYLYLEPKSFLREPYALADRADSGRDYFWNHLLKSSLFGTHNSWPDPETAYRTNRVVAYAMNGLLLAMLLYLLIVAAAFARRRALHRYAVVLLCLSLSVAFMIGFRALIPAPHHSDFRHIFSSLVLVSLLYAAAAGRARAWRPWLEEVGRTLALSFIGLSAFYFLPKQQLLFRLTRHTVQRELAQYATVVADGAPWDRPGNLNIQPNEVIELAVGDLPTARSIDVSLDNNDRYEIEIVGDDTRPLLVGPRPEKTGLARYQVAIDPPVAHVRLVRVRPLSGDYAYAMGHLVLR